MGLTEGGSQGRGQTEGKALFSSESGEHTETPQITPEQLLVDNRSDRAQEGRDIWRRARRAGKLTGVRGCADARLFIGDPATTRIRTIAAGGPEKLYAPLLKDPGVDKIVIMAHFAGSKVEPGKMPEGCGGLYAKKGELPAGALGRYIGNDLVSDDILVQTLYSAAATARVADNKPTLAVLQDHENGRILPVAAFNGDTIVTAIHFEELLNFQPERIYAEGIPVLDGTQLPAIFDSFLEASARHMSEVRREYPDLKARQQVQNPSTVVISAEPRPLQECFPETFKVPGSVFKISIPRLHIDSTVPISEESSAIALGQADFAIENSAANHNTKRPFAGTNTVLIETADFEVSTRLARDLLRNSSTQRWVDLDGKNIIVSEIVEGEVQRIEPFDFDNGKK